MARPVTLFTGQFANLPLTELAPLARSWGYDGLELACWGDHFEVEKALADSSYGTRKRELLGEHDLGCWAISNHLVGQAAEWLVDGMIQSRKRCELRPCGSRNRWRHLHPGPSPSS